MHFSTETFVEKIWIDALLEQQANIFKLGWNTIEVISALELPLLNICKVSPLSALNTFNLVPLIEAVQIKVPSGLTVIKATSDSWATISDYIDFSATKQIKTFKITIV